MHGYDVRAESINDQDIKALIRGPLQRQATIPDDYLGSCGRVPKKGEIAGVARDGDDNGIYLIKGPRLTGLRIGRQRARTQPDYPDLQR